MSKTFSGKAGKSAHVVKRRLADGSVKTYTYQRGAKQQRYSGDSIAALIIAYKTSPEWARLSKSAKTTYALYIKELERPATAHLRATELTRRELLSIRDAIATARGNGAATGFIRSAQSMLAWARDREWIDLSPAAQIKALPGGHLPAWTPQQAADAIAGLSEPLRRVVVLALYTGQRRGDLIALPWSAYDGLTIKLRQQKTGAHLVVPVHRALKAEMDRWERTSPIILTTAQGRPWQPQHISHMLPVALARLGTFPLGLNVHGLRKLAAANLADAGCSVHEIQAITGHKSLGMVQLYTASAQQEHLAHAAITRLENVRVKGHKRSK